MRPRPASGKAVVGQPVVCGCRNRSENIPISIIPRIPAIHNPPNRPMRSLAPPYPPFLGRIQPMRKVVDHCKMYFCAIWEGDCLCHTRCFGAMAVCCADIDPPVRASHGGNVPTITRRKKWRPYMLCRWHYPTMRASPVECKSRSSLPYLNRGRAGIGDVCAQGHAFAA